ncbi:MAG: hypothetical protein JEZ14_14125 [Marinilabiliaceae bacterium]|nr:hypothetical protein [Marinilabiliaceae bacterium]
MYKVLLIVAISLLVSCNRRNPEAMNMMTSSKHENGRNLKYLQCASNGKDLSNCLHLISLDKDTLSLKEIQQKEEVLFYYYSDMNCMMCVDEEIKRIKRFKKENPHMRIIILANYSNLRNLYVFKMSNSITVDMFDVKEEKLQLPIGKINSSFYFMIDKHCITKFVYVPVDNDVEHTNLYLEMVEENIEKYRVLPSYGECER